MQNRSRKVFYDNAIYSVTLDGTTTALITEKQFRIYKVIVCALLLALTVVYAWADSPRFYIKHRSSGYYFKTFQFLSSPLYLLVLKSSQKTTWTFEKVFDHWGYITDVSYKSGWVIKPMDESLNPVDKQWLMVTRSKDWSALFALDAANNHIIHKGGKYATPSSGQKAAKDGNVVTVQSNVHDNTRFLFVSTSDPNKGIHVYGTPTIWGKWEIINMVRNPIATHRQILKIHIGKSATQSRTTSFQYSWEITASFEYSAFSGSVSSSMQYMMERTSSFTWSEDITRVREIIVAPGTTAITWQYLFQIEQNLSKSVFRSNFLADTDSATKVPADLQIEL